MSINTNGILLGKISNVEIISALKEAFPNVTDFRTEFSDDDRFFKIIFAEPNSDKIGPSDASHRMLFVFNGHSSPDYTNVYSGERTILSLGYWGSSVEIIEALTTQFGGFIRKNDSNSEWELINSEPSNGYVLSARDRLEVDLAKIIPRAAANSILTTLKDDTSLEQLITAFETYKENRDLTAVQRPGI